MKFLVVAFSLLCGPALAQQPPPPDPAFLQKAIDALTAQRNSANNAAASWEARASMLADEIEKLKAEVERLKTKPPATEK